MASTLQYLNDNKIMIACLTETWFDTMNGAFSKSIKNSGYEIFHSYRDDKRGGGTAILYKRALKIKQGKASTNAFLSFEYSYISTIMQNMKTFIVCIYRNQEVSFSIFRDEFEKFMTYINLQCQSMILLGDFNVWGELLDDPETIVLYNLMSSFGYSQIVADPTHISGHTLDHIYINRFQIHLASVCVLNEEEDIFTDHFPLLISVPEFQVQPLVKKVVSFRELKSIDVDAFKEEFQNACDEVISFDTNQFKDKYEIFDKLSRDLIDKHAPLKTRTVKNKLLVPWIDTEFRECRAKRRKLEKKWKKSKSNSDKKAYVNQRRLCATLSINKQKDYYSKKIADAGNDQKKLFDIVNNMLDKTEQRVLPTHNNSKELADDFNQFYVDKIVKLRDGISNDGQYVSDSIFSGTTLDFFTPATETEVANILKEHGIKTSAKDPIPSSVFKQIVDEAVPLLTHLINLSLSTGSMDGIKSAIINPLLKKALLDIDEKKNYRPVSNLLFMSKLIERVVLNRLDHHMLVNNLFCKSQFGYKKYHSTETMMLGLVDDVLSGFDENLCTIIILLDLSAAFDTIDFYIMIQILHDEIGVRGVALDWFRSFLQGRTQQVKIDNAYSEVLDILFGTPQGSVLGPKLFSIYVRGQPKVFQRCQFNPAAFADDSNGTKKFSLSFQFDVIHNDVPDCLAKVTTYMNVHFLKINPDKTEFMLLHPKHLREQVIIRGAIIDGTCIRFSNKVKNVGFWLDENLDLSCHINKTVSHCYKLLKDIGRARNVLSLRNTEMLVHSVVTNRLDAFNSLFINIDKASLYKMQKVQNAAARLVKKVPRRVSVRECLSQLHWLPIESRIIFKILLINHKVIYGRCSANLTVSYKGHNCRPQDFLMLKTKVAHTLYGKRTFGWAAPRLWNALPYNYRSVDNTESFKHIIKTYLFQNTQKLLCKAFP